MSSTYAKKVPVIIAEMEKGREEDDRERRPDQDGEHQENTVYAYPFEGGGIVLTNTPIEEDQPETPIVESGELQTDQRPLPRKDPPYFLYFMLLLLLFICLESADTTLTTLFTPTANITIIPTTESIQTTATFPIGSGPGDVQGRVLPALTLSQSETVQATGKGHQDSRTASGTLTFFNGSFAAQTINTGTVYTGADGVQVVTEQTVTIPAANPPYVGEATVSASAIHAGASGNIQKGDISITTATLQVRNSQFLGGQDSRDFTYVQSLDIRQANSALTPLLLESEQGALSAQLKPDETLTTPLCTPRVFSNHKSGDEAVSVEVTVSETCKAAAYDLNSLQSAALRFVQGRLTKLNSHYQLIGTIQVIVRATTMQTSSPTLTAILHGVWVYQISEREIKTLVAGKPRLQAIQLVSKLPGVQRITISGISDNQPLPGDLTHIHILILVQE